MRGRTIALAVLLLGVPLQADILVDFNEDPYDFCTCVYYPTPSPDPLGGRHWNNVWGDIQDPNHVESFSDLVDTTGAVVAGLALSVSGFQADVPNGMNVDGAYPQTAQIDAVGTEYGEPPGIVTISGLTEPEYTIRLLSSASDDPERSWYNDDTRRTDFAIGGVTKTVHCYANTNYVESFWNVAPVGGVITVEVTGATPGGTETYSWGYLNVMEIIVPEPATLSLLALGCLAVIRRHRQFAT